MNCWLNHIGPCSICSGTVVLRYPGTHSEPLREAFAPSCHRTGEYGDLYRCEECGKRSTALLSSYSSPDPACPHCGKRSLRRLVSTFATVSSGESESGDGGDDDFGGDDSFGRGDDDFGAGDDDF